MTQLIAAETTEANIEITMSGTSASGICDEGLDLKPRYKQRRLMVPSGMSPQSRKIPVAIDRGMTLRRVPKRAESVVKPIWYEKRPKSADTMTPIAKIFK